jgi:DNA replication and repair protein RecF
MIITSLQIENFRNLKSVRADFGKGINIVTGDNAQGKTNLLEAIYLLVTGRSFRAQSDKELIPWNRDDYEATIIRATVIKTSGEEKFLVTFNQAQKHIAVNGESITRLGDLIGRINAVLFTPDDLNLVRGTPGERRRFMDIFLCQVSQQYLYHLQNYLGALRQRNALLKAQARRTNLSAELEPYSLQLAQNAWLIVRMRSELLNELAGLVSKSYAVIASNHEEAKLRYKPSIPMAGDNGQAEWEAAFVKRLADSAEEDAKRGSTSAGPHRDEFEFLLEGRSARDFGSQGQQRSCVLALKLAELKHMTTCVGSQPILMLDDLASELDENRRRAFLSEIEGCEQVFITGTEAQPLVSGLKPVSVFFMRDGNLLTSQH